MKLVVRVIEARNLPATDLNGLSDPYVRLQLGRHKFRTKVVKKNLNPHWEEEFHFRVEDFNDELLVSVMDEDKYFNDDFVGQLKVPVSVVFDAEEKSLGAAWHPLQPKHKKSKNKDCGEILLTINFSHNASFLEANCNGDHILYLKKDTDSCSESPSRSFAEPSTSTSPIRQEESVSSKEEKSSQKSFAVWIAQIFNKNADKSNVDKSANVDSSTDVDKSANVDRSTGVDKSANVSSGSVYMSETTETAIPEDEESKSEDQSFEIFGELMKKLESVDHASEVPPNLPGGVFVDQLYVIAPADLNSLLFSPDSSFLKSLAEVQGTKELQLGLWKFENGDETLKRQVTYLRAPSRLVKVIKGYEEQTYLKADGKNFAVLASVSTPDVMYGTFFKVEMLYCITPGVELPSGELSSRLVISLQINFLQSTMMKGMIENGARQGVKDNFDQYAVLLSQTVEPVDSNNLGSSKEQLLASVQAEPESDWKLAVQYFANFTVLSAVFLGLYVIAHIWLAPPSTTQGAEFVGLDLPDSIGEFIVSAVLVLHGERLIELISRFMQARVQKGSDHGVKAHGDGWLLTVALLEGSDLASVDSNEISDPYAVFTCNGQTRTSSVKFQKSHPHWNEIFEFDAMYEPPSVLDIEVYDFDGPFDEASSLGHGEINFLKTNISDLSDVWVPLRGKLALACQSKLHLRIFLNDTRGGNVVKEYLNKMEKEVGKKINVRSPQTNSAFQRLFGLPPEEFLINDFTCHLKRKMPLQGRLFLSARIIGFHANLFGHKTKFYFLWEDIEEFQVSPPTLSSMGSPIVVITLRPGRGMDARHGAKTQDEEGKLKFHFQSFVSFNDAQRTIVALWKARSLTPEQKIQVVEEESDTKTLATEESGSFLEENDVAMSEVHSSTVSVPSGFLMGMFSGEEIERKVMEKASCLDYSYTPWESEKGETFERQVYYKFDKSISHYRLEVTSTQQRSPLPDKNGWLVQEVMVLHGIPMGDYFNLHIKFQVEDLPSKDQGCKVQVHFGLEWLKIAKHKKRVTKNIIKNLQERLKVTFSAIEKEFASK